MTNAAPTRQTSAPRKRGDETRLKIIDETVHCIVEEGFAAATAKHVADRAGVTWGVIQYHFGDRNGLLRAVVDDGVSRLVETLSGADVGGLPLPERIDSSRQHLLEMNEATSGLGRLISDDPAHRDVAEVIWAALRGMVMAQMIMNEPIDWRRERRALVEMTIQQLR